MVSLKQRPTSPHLSLYSPMITSTSSILGRFAGIYLYFLSILLVGIFAYSIQVNKDVSVVLTMVQNFANSNQVGAIALILFTFGSLFAFFLYLFAIVRHLIWDFGYLLELPVSKIMGYLMFVFSFLVALGLTIYMFFI